MKWLFIASLILIGCIANSVNSSGAGSGYDVRYIDGCYYIITDQGGITAKVNQPTSCTE
jgi:hypothetical protein